MLTLILLFSFFTVAGSAFGYLICRYVHFDAIEERAALDTHVSIDEYICIDAPEFDPHANQFTLGHRF